LGKAGTTERCFILLKGKHKIRHTGYFILIPCLLMNELLSDQLKISTNAPHQELERTLIMRMRAMQTLEDYITLLQVFYSFFGALEGRISSYIGGTELPDHLQRRKSESLATDIRALGGVLPEKLALSDIPVIDDHLQAFGALYVMEGSTLGGQIISRMIAEQLGIGDKGLSFFQSYGEHRSTMWATFKLTLNRQAANEAERERIITAAGATFRKFKVLLDRG
jgi:heme oxygenase